MGRVDISVIVDYAEVIFGLLVHFVCNVMMVVGLRYVLHPWERPDFMPKYDFVLLFGGGFFIILKWLWIVLNTYIKSRIDTPLNILNDFTVFPSDGVAPITPTVPWPEAEPPRDNSPDLPEAVVRVREILMVPNVYQEVGVEKILSFGGARSFVDVCDGSIAKEVNKIVKGSKNPFLTGNKVHC